MTFILNIILIFSLLCLAVVLFLLIMRPEKTILKRGSLFLTLICLIAGLLRFTAGKEEHAATDHKTMSYIPASGYSTALNQSLEIVFAAYFSLSDVLATGNNVLAEERALQLKKALDSFDIEALVADTVKYDAVYLSLENAGAETTAIFSDPDLAEKRASMNILSREMFNLLTLLQAGNYQYYRLVCRDAFGKGNEGWWIGKTADSPNPYGIPGCSESRLITADDQPFIK